MVRSIQGSDANPNALYHERVDRLTEAVALKVPDRVPIVIYPGLWPCTYAGIPFQEAMYDHRRLAWACEKMIQNFSWDALSITGVYNARQWDALGSVQYAVPGRDLSPNVPYQARNISAMGPEDYTNLIKEPYLFTLDVAIRRICKEVDKPYPRDVIALIKGAIEFGQNREFWSSTILRWITEYGMPCASYGTTYTPLDWIGDYLRGFDQLCLDIHRLPEKVKEACKALLPYVIFLAKASAGDPCKKWKTKSWPPVFIPLHMAPYLSTKQFEEFYWPGFKKLVDTLARTGYLMWIFFESDWTRYLEYLKELPKGRIIAHFEYTDLVKAKTTIGDQICIAGNLPVNLLALGTSQMVKKQCKKLIDEVGEGGGYIMTTGQILAGKIKVVNVQTMTDFIMKYGIYRR